MHVDADPLTAALATAPAKGTLALNANGSFTYTPNANVNGSDTFTYRASDVTLTSALATVTITITPVNHAPVATDDSYATAEDTPLTVAAATGVLANDTDVDGDPLTAALATAPTKGTLALNANGSFTYTLNANVNGSDTFTYRASDGTHTSQLETLTITITRLNHAHVATNDSYATAEDTPLTVAAPSVPTRRSSDLDGDPLTAALATAPTKGTLALNANGSFTYTPNANVNGSDTFTYRA